jgi:hypothetical protein
LEFSNKMSIQPVKVYFLAFVRSELGLSNLRILASAPEVAEISVFIDGPRHNSDVVQLDFTESLFIKSKVDKVSRIIRYPTNVGLTEHLFRVMDHVHSESETILISEDDKKYSSGLSNALFMADAFKKTGTPFWIESIMDCHHPKNDQNSVWVQSMAKPTGLALLNKKFVKSAEELYQSKNLDWMALRNSLQDYCEILGLHRRQSARVINHYLKAVTWVLDSKDRPDGLLLAKLLSNGLYRTTNIYFNHENVQHLDFRGKNENEVTVQIPKHELNTMGEPPINFCGKCEFFRLRERSPYTDFDYTTMKIRAAAGRVLNFIPKRI